ncbi:hypothetical protein Kuura_039 [Caulobacter phage Kuura]|nr:hypothetical protein Kuura_039 [Caulobacter phage Kuura]
MSQPDLNITDHDRQMAASLAAIAIRRCDSPSKAVASLMMAAVLIGVQYRDPSNPMFHFVALIKKTFDGLADATLGFLDNAKEEADR